MKDAGAEIHLMKKTEKTPTRYPYLHAKYTIIDSKTTIIMSENWGLTGISVNGNGNRGWGAVINSNEVAFDLGQIFESDFSLTYGDVVQFNENIDATFTELEPTLECCQGIDPLIINSETNVKLVVTPDNSLSEDTIIEMIRGATNEILIQQHQLRSMWGDEENPYLIELAKAVDRGVKISVMIDGTQQQVAESNQYAYLMLNEMKEAGGNVELLMYRSPMEEFTRIHNKGIIVDQKFTLISSINWGSGGGALNREIGIIIESEEIAEYYREIFLDDWNGREIDEENTIIDEEVTEENEKDDGFFGMPSISFVLAATILALVSRNLFNRNRLS